MSNLAIVFQYGLTFGGGLLAKFLWDRVMLERSKDTMIRTLLNEMNHISLLQAESTIVPIPTDVLDNIRASSAFTHISKDLKFNLRGFRLTLFSPSRCARARARLMDLARYKSNRGGLKRR